MRVLLVQPPLDPITSQMSALGMPEPLGLEYLAGALKGHTVRISDLRQGILLVDEISSFDPQILGITSVTAGLNTSLQLVRKAKSLNPQMTTVIGGVHATLLPDDCKISEMDIVAQGDGEQTILEIVEALEARRTLSSVSGIHYKDQNEWHVTTPRKILPLDSYPLPARNLVEKYRSAYARVGIGPVVSTISSRGCSRRCSFCSIWRFHQGKYRHRSSDKIIEELLCLPEKCVDFIDDDSFGNLKYMEELRESAERHLPDRLFKFYVRADAVVKAPDLFYRWAETGLRLVFMGLESFHDDQLLDFNKTSSAEDNIKALKILKKAGITVVGSLIIKPDFSLDDFKRLADDVERFDIRQPFFTTLTPLPGTILYEQMKGKILQCEWEDFDGFTAVLPTKLPRSEYYRELANLYRRAYRNSQPLHSGPEIPWHEQLAQAIESIEDKAGSKSKNRQLSSAC
jgi:hopanoid C-3 methylase